MLFFENNNQLYVKQNALLSTRLSVVNPYAKGNPPKEVMFNISRQ